jgi:hypothetical protein
MVAMLMMQTADDQGRQFFLCRSLLLAAMRLRLRPRAGPGPCYHPAAVAGRPGRGRSRKMAVSNGCR